MHNLNLKPTHKPVAEYYKALGQFKALRVSHEGAVRSAFQDLLDACCSQFNWKLIPEWHIKQRRGNALRADGALVDGYRLSHGLWEAKDASDDLAKRSKKDCLGYPTDNILFSSAGARDSLPERPRGFGRRHYAAGEAGRHAEAVL